MLKPLIWKTHRRREYGMDVCPHCGGTIKWVRLGDGSYAPCDHEPTLFILHPEGRSTVVHKGEVFDKALIYKQGDVRFAGTSPLQARVQHYYTCPVLKGKRIEYAKGNKYNEK